MSVDITYLKGKEMDFYHVFQPIFTLSQNTVHGYEVLLRSNDFSNPEMFFNYAKEQNILFELDMRSIEKACKSDLSFFGETLLFINIFPSTLVHPEFMSRMGKIKEELRIKSDSIVFEINETEKGDVEILSNVIEKLRNQGYLIALDDIGKGNSTLQSIIELEPDIIKLDRFLAKNIASSVKKQAFIEKIVQIFEGDFSIVLEGIETKEDLQVSVELGVPFAQGFYLGKPREIDYYGNI